MRTTIGRATLAFALMAGGTPAFAQSFEISI